ncbi:MAG: type II toxin-antitoxin system RelE/ParE family toxin [Planctomycetes bacterium]|nr:type II toxin-antitoxin system RelE/ParE family toxin [Planctomycetota bacterium]
MSPPLLIKVSRRASAQVERAAAWWQENRSLAPGAVREDVARALSLLSTHPGLGIPARHASTEGIRRLTLSRIRYYLYYRVSRGTLEVLAFWHTSRGREPRL